MRWVGSRTPRHKLVLHQQSTHEWSIPPWSVVHSLCLDCNMTQYDTICMHICGLAIVTIQISRRKPFAKGGTLRNREKTSHSETVSHYVIVVSLPPLLSWFKSLVYKPVRRWNFRHFSRSLFVSHFSKKKCCLLLPHLLCCMNCISALLISLCRINWPRDRFMRVQVTFKALRHYIILYYIILYYIILYYIILYYIVYYILYYIILYYIIL